MVIFSLTWCYVTKLLNFYFIKFFIICLYSVVPIFSSLFFPVEINFLVSEKVDCVGHVVLFVSQLRYTMPASFAEKLLDQ